MPTLTAKQVGWMDQKPTPESLVRAPSPRVKCPFCDKNINPTGNVRTHSVKTAEGTQVIYWRSHIACAKEALPGEREALDVQAFEIYTSEQEAERQRALLRKH